MNHLKILLVTFIWTSLFCSNASCLWVTAGDDSKHYIRTDSKYILRKTDQVPKNIIDKPLIFNGKSDQIIKPKSKDKSRPFIGIILLPCKYCIKQLLNIYILYNTKF